MGLQRCEDASCDMGGEVGEWQVGPLEPKFAPGLPRARPPICQVAVGAQQKECDDDWGDVNEFFSEYAPCLLPRPAAICHELSSVGPSDGVPD